ncbi:MAG: hypothetical protein GY941_29320 [Planctomycetes bacterium]|nr:hypothetical protein [Planctomycetota bacterium]
MADVNVNFMHPTDGRLLSVELDDTITAQEAIAELISENFIPSSAEGYALSIKGGGAMLSTTQTFRDAGVQDNTVLRIIPQTDAG